MISIKRRWAANNYQLRLSEQLGWALGSMGTGVMIGALTGYGHYYMTYYLGIGAGLASLHRNQRNVVDWELVKSKLKSL